MAEVVIIGAARTPMGGFQESFPGYPPPNWVAPPSPLLWKAPRPRLNGSRN